MPKPSVTTAINVNPGELRRVLVECCKSCQRLRINNHLKSSGQNARFVPHLSWLTALFYGRLNVHHAGTLANAGWPVRIRTHSFSLSVWLRRIRNLRPQLAGARTRG